jgi:hypothetical protein
MDGIDRVNIMCSMVSPVFHTWVSIYKTLISNVYMRKREKDEKRKNIKGNRVNERADRERRRKKVYNGI